MTSHVHSQFNTLPNHVFVILDGNRTWAEDEGASYEQAYRQGADVFEQVALHAVQRDIRYLTGWILGAENLEKRDANEVEILLTIMQEKFVALANNRTVHDQHVHIKAVGDWHALPHDVGKAIEEALDATDRYERFFLTLLVNYSGTRDLLAMGQALMNQGASHGASEVTAEVLAANLLTRDLPEVDLMIRTKGKEPHLSDRALAWQMNNAELYFPEMCWPNFTPAEFDRALAEYARRQRKAGK